MTARPGGEAPIAALSRTILCLVVPLLVLVVLASGGPLAGSARAPSPETVLGRETGPGAWGEAWRSAFAIAWLGLVVVSIADRATAGRGGDPGVTARAAFPFLLSLTPAALVQGIRMLGQDFPDGARVVMLLVEIGGIIGVVGTVASCAKDPWTDPALARCREHRARRSVQRSRRE